MSAPQVKFDGLACNSRLIRLKLHSLSRSNEAWCSFLLSYHVGTFGWVHPHMFLGIKPLKKILRHRDSLKPLPITKLRCLSNQAWKLTDALGL
jgi:hypothetical protein